MPARKKHWKGIGNEGPVTRAYLGVEAPGRTVLYEWNATTPVELEAGDVGLAELCESLSECAAI